MAKLTTSDLTSLTSNEASAVSTINANFALVETAMENTLSRDGTSPNTMGADIDMNSNDLLNVALGQFTRITINGVAFDAPGNLTVDDLADATITAAATGDILRYNGTAWVDYPDSNYATSGHTHAIDDISDVTITAAASGDLLRFNGTAWVDYPDSNYATSGHNHSGVYEPVDADILRADTTDDLTVGYTTTAYNAGTKSTGTFTPDATLGAMQYAVNGGAHTLAPPSPGAGKAVSMCIQYTNNASAGTITTSSFTKVNGDTLTTTDGHDFLFYITVLNGFSHLNVVALQ